MFTTLRSKIFAGFAAIIAINVVFALWAIFRFSQIGVEVNRNVAEHYRITGRSIRLSQIVEDQYRLLHRYSVGALEVEPGERLQSLAAEFSRTLNEMPVDLRDRDSIVLPRIRESYRRFDSLSKSFITAEYRSSDISASLYLLDTVYPSAQSLERECFALADLSRSQIDAVEQGLTVQLRRTLLFVGIGTVVAALVGILGGGIYSRWALRSIDRLRQAVKTVGSGQLGHGVRITSADELGELSFEFNRMLEQLRRYEAMNLENLLLEKRKAQAIVESITTPILVVGNEMRILLVNVAALRLFRKPINSALEGSDVTNLTDDENIVAKMRSVIAGGTEEGEGTTSESLTWITESEGMERYYLVQMIPLKASGSTAGAMAVFADVTEFKELDRLKSEFLARISHEFRTPLSSILMSIDILREGLLGEINQRQHELLDNAKEDCRRLSRLINDILEMSRLEADLGRKSPEEFDPEDLARSVIQPHLLIAGERGIDLRCHVESGLPLLWADPEHFRWILNNLVSNAIKHTDEGGSVDVQVGREGEEFFLIVRDTGSGIPLDSMRMIFERFYQVEQGERSTPGSVGLGLAIVKEVVESYGGTIAVSSELNKGAAFTVRIPFSGLRMPEGLNPTGGIEA